jgi:hypothetical protein
MLKDAAESPPSTAPGEDGRAIIFCERNTPAADRWVRRAAEMKYTPKWQARKPNAAMEMREIRDSRGAPWFPVELI